MFDKFKNFASNVSQAFEMQRKAKEIDEKLRNNVFEVENDNISLKINAKKEIIDIAVKKDILLSEAKEDLKQLINTSLTKADSIVMKEMKSLVSY